MFLINYSEPHRAIRKNINQMLSTALSQTRHIKPEHTLHPHGNAHYCLAPSPPSIDRINIVQNLNKAMYVDEQKPWPEKVVI